jgi:SAM-dependent methyltransferase
MAPLDFMLHSTCSAADLLHPRCLEICRWLHHPAAMHRKLWEWVFIVHKLDAAGMLKPGVRGLGFGVGRERLPAFFASRGVEVVATDAPPDLAASVGWTRTDEHSGGLRDLSFPAILPDAVLAERVSHRVCDMRSIDPALRGFDFTWSACSLEHLGSLEAGLQFVVDSVERTLRPGGLAVHTTEFNLSSDLFTVRRGDTVLYRRRDLRRLVDLLRRRGHEVEPFVVAPDTQPPDFHVDVPPYTHDPHLRLRLGRYTCTSAGIAVRRGPVRA